MELSQEQREAMEIIERIYDSHGLSSRHPGAHFALAAALLEAQARGYRRGRIWHQLQEDPKIPERLRREAQQLREPKEPHE